MTMFIAAVMALAVSMPVALVLLAAVLEFVTGR